MQIKRISKEKKYDYENKKNLYRIRNDKTCDKITE